MKKTLLLYAALYCFSIQFLFAQQWSGSTSTSGNISRNGNVGIGPLSPIAPLQVSGASEASSSSSINGTILISSATTNLINTLGIHTATGNPYSWIQTTHRTVPSATYPIALNPRGGNVGIGITNPKTKLHIFNGDNSYGAILANATEDNFSLYTKTIDTWPVNSESFRIGLKYDNNENNGFISFYRGGSSVGGFLGFSTYGAERMRILSNGNIGIGTSTTGTHKLAVDGTIGAHEIKVESGAWSDFVFKEDYPLKDLKEIETYIQENQHLPDIPSEAEILENGIELGKMDAKLLQKIEELTLYTIQQQKELDFLKTKNTQLEEQVNKFENLESQLKALQDQIQKLTIKD